MAPPRSLRLPDGRRLTFDDIGDPAGVPVVLLHGTPDSRLARHPDDALAGAAGVRLIAIDRPGAGGSDPNPSGGLSALGADLAHLLDHLGLPRAALLGWSSGGLFALAAAGELGERVRTVVLVGTVPPVEAYHDPAVVAALGPARRPFAELALELSPGEIAAELAPYLVSQPLTAALARDHVAESAGPVGRAELGAVPGATDQMVLALFEAVRGGTEGLARDIERQLEAGVDLSRIASPVQSYHGTDDPVSPPEVGRWLAERLPTLRLEVLPGAGHHLLFPRWRSILDATRDLGSPDIGC